MDDSWREPRSSMTCSHDSWKQKKIFASFVVCNKSLLPRTERESSSENREWLKQFNEIQWNFDIRMDHTQRSSIRRNQKNTPSTISKKAKQRKKNRKRSDFSVCIRSIQSSEISFPNFCDFHLDFSTWVSPLKCKKLSYFTFLKLRIKFLDLGFFFLSGSSLPC